MTITTTLPKLTCEIVRMGIMSSDHDGFGTAYSPYDYAVQGIGNTQAEAMEDALEQAAQCAAFSFVDFDMSDIEAIIEEARKEAEYYNDLTIDEQLDALNANASDIEDYEPDYDISYYAGFRWCDPEPPTKAEVAMITEKLKEFFGDMFEVAYQYGFKATGELGYMSDIAEHCFAPQYIVRPILTKLLNDNGCVLLTRMDGDTFYAPRQY